MGKPPTTDQELTLRVAALEDRADATDAAVANLVQGLDAAEADISLLIDRTDALDARVTALEAAATVPTPEPPEPGPEPIPKHRTVSITLDGQEHVLHEQNGTDLGDWVGPHFTQRCIRCTCDTLPGFSVMFRPDADGTREEVVFELGAIWPTQPAAMLGAYTATICIGDETPVVVSVPHHNWFGRWRWQSAPRPVIADVRSLIDASLLPHYDASVGGGYTPPSQVRTYVGPMDLAGITPYMPQTGDRDDIGIVTEQQADYLCTQSDAALSSLLAQLEGSGTLTWHYRDENTGAPLDIFTYPKASTFNPYTSDPYIPWQVGDGGGITLDTAHEPDLAYVPYLLTGDPYALEELQFAVTYNYVVMPPDGTKGTYNIYMAVRAHAWALRSMAHAARVTPEQVPRWLLPRSHFRRLLDGNRDFVASLAARTDAPYAGVYALADSAGAPPEYNIPADCAHSTWMEDFEVAVQGHVVEMGFDDWRANYEWKIKHLIERTNGTSGWNRGVFPYKTALRETKESPYVTGWGDCWTLNIAMGAWADPGTEDIPAGGLNYPSYGYAALAIAARLGIAGAEACHAWMAGQFNAIYAPDSLIYARWSIA